jgi:hypothetical protein
MFQFRQALVRLRAGDTVREIARTGLMGRDKLYELAALARERGWLEAGAELPDNAAIAQALKPRKRAASRRGSSACTARSVCSASQSMVGVTGSRRPGTTTPPGQRMDAYPIE